jgi:hypothetical protein
MRNPIRGETDAFYVAVGAAGLIAASVAVGAIAEPLVGVALFAGGVVGALIWDVSTKDPDRRRPLREAALAGAANTPSRRRRVLVVANRTLAGGELRARIRRAAAGDAEFHVVAPILTSRIHYIASDVDTELAEARERLNAALAWAEAEGLDATGTVGDPNAALGAIEDELRRYGADEVIISTHPPGKSNWLETGIVERLRDELDVPVEHVVVDAEHSGQPTER